MRIKQILIAIDQLGNTLIGGYADETISSQCWRRRNESSGWWRAFKFVDAIFGDGHCQESYLSERKRLQLPPEFRQSQ